MRLTYDADHGIDEDIAKEGLTLNALTEEVYT